MQNNPQFIISYHAILHAGGFVFPRNPILKEMAVAFIQNDTKAKNHFMCSKALDRALQVLDSGKLE